MFDPKKMIQSGVSNGVKAGISFLAAKGIIPVLVGMGVTIDQEQLTVYLTGLALVGLTMVANWLKNKAGIKIPFIL